MEKQRIKTNTLLANCLKGVNQIDDKKALDEIFKAAYRKNLKTNRPTPQTKQEALINDILIELDVKRVTDPAGYIRLLKKLTGALSNADKEYQQCLTPQRI